jgi:hypothetical protein
MQFRGPFEDHFRNASAPASTPSLCGVYVGPGFGFEGPVPAYGYEAERFHLDDRWYTVYSVQFSLLMSPGGNAEGKIHVCSLPG